MAKRINKKGLVGIRLYNYILKKLGEENKKRPKKLQLGADQRRKLVSKELYPFFKGKKISLTEIGTKVKQTVTKLPPAEICNPLFLSEAYLSFIEYYELDNHIQTVLPPCVDVKVNAGQYGRTRMFNTANYSYYTTGIRRIIENIRHQLAKEKSGVASFNGIVKLKRNKKNDGNPSNYYIEYILYVNDIPEGDDEPIDFDLPKSEQKKADEVKQYLSQQFRELQKEKRKRKRRKQTKKIQKPEEKNKLLNKKVKDAIESIKALQRAGIITKEQFEEQKKNILRLKKP